MRKGIVWNENGNSLGMRMGIVWNEKEDSLE